MAPHSSPPTTTTKTTAGIHSGGGCGGGSDKENKRDNDEDEGSRLPPEPESGTTGTTTATTTTTIPATTRTAISFQQLIEPVSRCVLLALLLVVSTGPLVRTLLATTLADLAALAVGTLWFLGDILPCLALALVFHDAVLARPSPLFIFRRGNRTDRRAGSSSSSKSTSTTDEKFLNAIVVIFTLLYCCDFVIFVFTSDTPSRLLENYRYAFFHVQIFLSLAYLLKFWRWSRSALDLRELAAKFERFYGLAHKMTRALIALLDRSRPGNSETVDHQSQSGIDSAGPRNWPLETDESPTITTTKLQTSVSEDPLPPIDASEPSASRSGNAGRPNRRPRATSAVNGNSLSSNIRVNTRRTGARRAAKRATATRQTIIMRGGGGRRQRRRTSATNRRRGARHRCSSACDCSPTAGGGGGRTVNLNLNMS